MTAESSEAYAVLHSALCQPLRRYAQVPPAAGDIGQLEVDELDTLLFDECLDISQSFCHSFPPL